MMLICGKALAFAIHWKWLCGLPVENEGFGQPWCASDCLLGFKPYLRSVRSSGLRSWSLRRRTVKYSRQTPPPWNRSPKTAPFYWSLSPTAFIAALQQKFINLWIFSLVDAELLLLRPLLTFMSLRLSDVGGDLLACSGHSNCAV